MQKNQQVLDSFVKFMDNSKDKLLKACQYILLMISSYYQSKGEQEKKFQYFSIYSRIFHLRRIHRLAYSITFLSQIKMTFIELKKQTTAQKLLLLIKEISRFCFYVFDNASQAMKLIQYKHYQITRRVSFSIFAISIVIQLIYHVIRLRKNFALQADIRSQIINKLTPVQFLKKLSRFDEERLFIIINIFSNIGDIVPALQRINLPETLLRTKIQAGVVGFFGFIASLMDLLKIYHRNQNMAQEN